MNNKTPLFILLALVSTSAIAQEDPDADMPRKGSYLFHGQPVLEDNSMLIDEALNQGAGAFQYISNLVLEDGSATYSFCHELPLSDYKHQISFEGGYANLDDGTSGVTDMEVMYRPCLTSKYDWALVAPGFTLIIPSGDASKGLGDGAFGGAFNLAVCKRIAKQVVTHWNAGYTLIPKAKSYGTNEFGESVRLNDRQVGTCNLGASAIWLVKDNFNLMAEYLYEGTTDHEGFHSEQTINPGFRAAAQIGKAQIVPGLGLPFYEEEGAWKQRGVMVYLSIEPAY